MARLVKILDLVGHGAQEPPVWAALAMVLAMAGGPRGRRAALRGTVCYAVTAVVANLIIKPVVRRPRPPEAGKGRPGPVTTSFPSGHAATDVAFTIGAAQELPSTFVPLAAASVAAHWSLVRSRGHYFSDVLVGGLLGMGLAAAVARVWPVRQPDRAR